MIKIWIIWTRKVLQIGVFFSLEGICPGAYEAFQNSRDLKAVIEKCGDGDRGALVDFQISVGVPVKPMLVSYFSVA